MICAELIDGLCDAPGTLAAARLRTAGHLRDPDLSVVLADVPFRVLRLGLRLVRSERGGEIGPGAPRSTARAGGGAGAAPRGGSRAPRLPH